MTNKLVIGDDHLR